MKLNKTCIFYHGLCGEPISWVKTMLNEKGYYVHQEHIDFYKEWYKDRGQSMMEKQFKKAEKADLIAGLSFGGYVAYLAAKSSGSDLLLVNPAVNRARSTTGIGNFRVPELNKDINIEVFFGQMDMVVPSRYTQEFFQKTGEKYTAWQVNNMQHGISNLDFHIIINHSELIKKACK
jgi:hypothetical protein